MDKKYYLMEILTPDYSGETDAMDDRVIWVAVAEGITVRQTEKNLSPSISIHPSQAKEVDPDAPGVDILLESEVDALKRKLDECEQQIEGLSRRSRL